MLAIATILICSCLGLSEHVHRDHHVSTILPFMEPCHSLPNGRARTRPSATRWKPAISESALVERTKVCVTTEERSQLAEVRFHLALKRVRSLVTHVLLAGSWDCLGRKSSSHVFEWTQRAIPARTRDIPTHVSRTVVSLHDIHRMQRSYL